MPGGRPPKWTDPAVVQGMIDKYFEETPQKQWTITGLALALDTYRDTLMRYQNKDEFSNTIKRAKQKVQHAYELDLREKGRSGDIFALKNFGWVDKQEIDSTHKVVEMPTIKRADGSEVTFNIGPDKDKNDGSTETPGSTE